TDICIYGGTSGGVIAAVQAARMGRSVSLVVVGNHLGGMTSGGLGQTDVGSFGTDYIQGVAREFYTRVGQKYGTGARFTFEPHVAETVFNEMAAEAGVKIYTNQYLVSVTTNADTSIASITMNNGNVFRAKMYIDASYEGDLMAKAGVSYTIGREASSQYGENLNGVRAPNSSGHQFGSVVVNPYVVTNDPDSGLLPLVQTNSVLPVGSADNRVQAYNFRICLTQNADNKIPITAPTNYDVAQYELLARYIQALVAKGSSLSLANFMGIYSMPNGKTDINNNGPISTDFIGESDTYAEADHATRAKIWQAHKNYIQGFFYFLANDSRVPASLRNQMQAYGFCRDEFSDNGGWPYELYVREARRMVSDYVITQSNCLRQTEISDPIGLATYAMDSHNCERLVVNGHVENEGDTYNIGGVPGAWQIPYRSIIPKKGQCRNLLVPWCVSASHIAFGSLRMEPVFMIVSQSAATAACLAMDDNVSVQQLDYAKLRLQLLADHQALGETIADNGIILDNADPGVVISGDWTSSKSSGGYYGTNYLHDGNAAKGTKSVRFNPMLTAGNYGVYLRWTTDPNRASNVPVDVISANGTNTFSFNQQQNGGQWNYIGTFPFNAGTKGCVVVRTTGTSGYVIADAARFVSADILQPVDVIASRADANKWQTRAGWFTVVRSGDTTAPLTVNYILSGTASNGVDYLPLDGSVVIPAGAVSAKITVTPIANNIVEGDRTITVTLAESTNYNFGTFSNATITIHEMPLAAWQLDHFTSTELADSEVSGDAADPNHDGFPNIAEYALGLDPKNANESGKPFVSIQNNRLTLTFSRAKAAMDVAVNVESSTNLMNWNSGPDYVDDSVVADDGEKEIHIAQAKIPVESRPMAFLRLKISR
ncbi:MAG TPA: FAD-dependent oxidoreductase, partial [Verrucomicrobiae bacterium]|nr:FAD-dependent oxidoreductase [Verrucomicrobiae bacterium]